MSERGVFAMDRGWFEHAAFPDEPFTQREAWAWLISEASFRQRQKRLIGRVFDLRRGQLVASVRYLAERWQWHRSKVERFLVHLRVHDMIETATETGATIITICNYNKYQKVSKPTEETNKTEPRQSRDKEESIKNIKLDDGVVDAHASQLGKEPLISPEALALADEIAVIAGVDPKFPPPAWCGAAHDVSKWLREGWTRDVILIAVRKAVARKRDGPIFSIRFFEYEIAREVARQARPLPIVAVQPGQIINGGANGTHRNSGREGFTADGQREKAGSRGLRLLREASAAREAGERAGA